MDSSQSQELMMSSLTLLVEFLEDQFALIEEGISSL